jgi:hypothetical protein
MITPLSVWPMKVSDEGVPRLLAVQLLELEVVVVVAGEHAVGGEPAGQAVEELGQLEPVLPAGGQLPGDPGDDHVGVPHRPVEGDRLLQPVVLHRRPGGVPAAADEPGLVQHRPQLGAGSHRRAGELDALVAHPGHGLEGRPGVLLERLADGVEL